MTKTYWTVVYRPRGSECWTPAMGPGPYWFGKRATANARACMLQYNNPEGEYRTARVEVEE